MDRSSVRLPFIPFPKEKLEFLMRKLEGFARFVVSFFPGLSADLREARIEMDAVEYMAYVMSGAILMGIIVTSLLLYLAFVGNVPMSQIISIAIPAGVLVMIMMTIYGAIFPKARARKIATLIEKDLPFALRHLLIEIQSGIPLFDAMVSVAQSGYGKLSEEFARTVKDIDMGMPRPKALEEMAHRNASEYVKRLCWQLISAMEVGFDIKKVLEDLLKEVEKEQEAKFLQYGQELNMYTLMYMMIAVIAPSLGLSFLMMVAMFVGFQVTPMLLAIIAVGVAFFQLMFLNMIKARRPLLSI